MDEIKDKEKPLLSDDEKEELPGYPGYPVDEDIFKQDKEESEIDPEDITKRKEPVDKSKTGKNEKDFEEDKSGNDLDVPGSELDDEQEENGNEDEENNYYSIGGDDHDDLGQIN